MINCDTKCTLDDLDSTRNLKVLFVLAVIVSFAAGFLFAGPIFYDRGFKDGINRTVANYMGTVYERSSD